LGSGSLWFSSDQLFRLSREGNQLQILYAVPRQGMLDEGVRTGTMLFSGTIDADGTIKGLAHRFSARCKAAVPYHVSGSIDASHRTIRLWGTANFLDERCNTVPGEKADFLEFKKQI
jgi:hypothetical protein